MLTRLRGYDEQSVQVSSMDEEVMVTVPCQAEGLPLCALSRAEAHEVLVKAKSAAEDFIAAVEGDLEDLR